MNRETLLKLGVMFMLGFLSANIIGFYFVYGSETPLLKTFGFSSVTNEQAPFGLIKQNQIEVYQDMVVIKVNNASISSYAATGSMEPVLDENSHGIRIVPKSEEEIHVGDIISFDSNGILIVHRVIEMGTDSEGVYFITKGDHNSVDDGKIRFSQVRYKTVGIIY